MADHECGGRVVRIEATADQRYLLEQALLNPDVREVGFGGARGTVKTFCFCLAVGLYLLQNPGEQFLCLRKTERAAIGNLKEEFDNVFRLLGVKVKFNVQRSDYILPGRSEIHIRHCASEEDYRPYQGLPYAGIWFEEATQHTEAAYRLVGGSRRPRRIGTKPLRLASANPGEVGDQWFKKRFVNKSTRPKHAVFLGGKLFDSLPTLERSPGYFDEELSGLPEGKIEQWVYGNWNAIVGAYFDIPPACIAEVEVPPWAKWYSTSDWGYWPDPFASLWLAVWEDDNGYKRMHVAAELRLYKTLPDDQARKALEMEERAYDAGWITGPVRMRYADPSCWKRQEHERTEMGRSIASMWQRSGWAVIKATTNARVPGWMVVRRLLRVPSREGLYPALTMSPRCKLLLDELRYAVQEENGNDIAKSCDDHFLDALRYAVVSLFGVKPPSDRQENVAAELPGPPSGRYKRMSRIAKLRFKRKSGAGR